jgi:uncharacterized membrane protein
MTSFYRIIDEIKTVLARQTAITDQTPRVVSRLFTMGFGYVALAA